MVNLRQYLKKLFGGSSPRCGRPTKEELVAAYFTANPAATVRGAASALGISKTTVQKWRP